jgi:hypothetical protein
LTGGWDAGWVVPAERMEVVVLRLAAVEGDEVPGPGAVVVATPDPAPTAGLVAPPPTEP